MYLLAYSCRFYAKFEYSTNPALQLISLVNSISHISTITCKERFKLQEDCVTRKWRLSWTLLVVLMFYLVKWQSGCPLRSPCYLWVQYLVLWVQHTGVTIGRRKSVMGTGSISIKPVKERVHVYLIRLLFCHIATKQNLQH